MNRRVIQFLLSIVLLFSTLACTKEKDGSVFVNFINATGDRIENAEIDGLVIGNIEPNAQTGFIRFSEFGTDTGMPDVNFTGIQNGQTIESTSKFYWCGTEKSALKPGRYVVQINLQRFNNHTYFNLSFK